MAFRTKKISQMDPKGSNLASTDLLEISQLVSGSYVTKSITGAEIIASVPASVTAWGTITGTLSTQTDLQNALNAKQATVTLTTTGTSGASTFVANTLNVPTYSLSGLGGVPTTRTLTINGTTQDLSADRTFTISTGITIGTTAITSGTVGRVLFEGTGNVVQESAGLTYNDTTKAFSVIGNQNATTNISVLNTDTTSASSRARISVTSGTIIGSLQSIIGNDFYIGTESAHNVNFITAGATKFNINNTSGNVTFGALASDIGARLGTKGVGNTSATKAFLAQNSSSTDLFTIWNDGAIGVNTNTNAGFKLDVNGTARVSGEFKVSTNTTIKVDGTFQHNYLQTQYGACIGALAYNVASSILELRSTTSGFLPPRMTTTQKNAIASPATGLMVYDTTLNVITYYNGTTWI